MFIFTRRRSVAAAILAVVVVVIPTSAGGEAVPPPAPAGVTDAAKKCPHGVHTLAKFKWYASRVYKRTTVTQKAHNRKAYLIRCQRSAWGKRWAGRYARRYKREREARALAARVFPVSAHLRAIAQCESGGNPRAISPGGTYRGKYQFSFATWQSVGGTGDPAQASEYEQDRRAAILYRRSGPGQWPVCGR